MFKIHCYNLVRKEGWQKTECYQCYPEIVIRYPTKTKGFISAKRRLKNWTWHLPSQPFVYSWQESRRQLENLLLQILEYFGLQTWGRGPKIHRISYQNYLNVTYFGASPFEAHFLPLYCGLSSPLASGENDIASLYQVDVPFGFPIYCM